MPDTFAEQILKSRSIRHAERLAMEAAKCRERARFSHKSRVCSACGQGLKIRVFAPGQDAPEGFTLMVCPGCNATHRLPYQMTEGRYVGEQYIPGVTGRPRGTTVITMDPLTKKITNVRKV